MFIRSLYLFLAIFGYCFAQDQKPPFRVLYSNDFTNIESCKSPYHKAKQKWSPFMLQATVDETAGTGVDAHFLQPAHGWVPWWPSEVYSMQRHYEWWHDKYGNYPVLPVHEYILKGGDPLDVFIRRCRQMGQAPFISLRLNDAHHLENVDTPGNTKGFHAICEFYAENPEYRLGSDLSKWDKRIQNWAIKEVRDYKLSLIKEICDNYDIAGIELDFMRKDSFFDIEQTTTRQRVAIMQDFVKRVRRFLDNSQREGQHRWLCVRIPIFVEKYSDIGIDIKRFVDSGVDMINASVSYFTIQQHDIGEIISLAGDVPVYLELCHTTLVGKSLAKAYDSFTFKRTTDEQFYTAAHLAYQQGAAGVSAFNFVYYREHGVPGRGPFSEPPFHIFNSISNREWVAKQPQHYVLSKAYLTKQMPFKIKAGQVSEFSLFMTPPSGGWSKNGKLVLQSLESVAGQKMTLFFNGVELSKTTDVTCPYEVRYESLLCESSNSFAWIVPFKLLRAGRNDVRFHSDQGRKNEYQYLEIFVE